jgi:AAA15 family ATPase/GTPase
LSSDKLTNKKCNPVSVFWGRNASGKSNIVEAFDVFTRVVVNELYAALNPFSKEFSHLPFRPNKLVKGKGNTTEFEIEVVINTVKYNYIVEYNSDEIIREEFFKNDKLLFSNSNFDELSKINKEYDEDRLKAIFDAEVLAYDVNDKNSTGKKIQNKSFLGVLALKYTGLNIDISMFSYFVYSKLVLFLDSVHLKEYIASDLIINNDKEKAKKRFNEISTIIKKLDVDIQSMELIENMEEKRINHMDFLYDKGAGKSITTYHKDSKGNMVSFNFDEESKGTQRLFGVIGFCLKALETGSVLVIDELETSLHPKLVKEIIKLFKSKTYNKNNAQLIFTTHNTDILDNDTLRTNEIYIIDKTSTKGTFTTRLSDFKDENGKKIKNIDNFRKMYLSGMLGGIPYASI